MTGKRGKEPLEELPTEELEPWTSPHSTSPLKKKKEKPTLNRS